MRMVLAMFLAVLLVAAPALAGHRLSVEVLEDTNPPSSSPIVIRTADVCISFDEDPEPCVATAAYPLQTKYSSLGVTFAGPTSISGGAIFDECSNFGVSGYSSPNFIGFNLNATLASGGCECYPESLLFSSAVDSVSAMVGVGFGATGTISMKAYDAGGSLVDQATVNNDGSGVVQLLAVGGPAIKTVIVDAAISSYAFMLDDLCFNFDQTTGTENTTWGSVKQLYR